MKVKRIVILGLTAFGLMAGVAVATPGLFVSASPPVRGTIAEPFKVKIDGLLKLKTKGPIDVVDQTITIQPGGHTGWHSHPGPVLVVVKSGTFTLYDGDDPTCTPHAFNAGSTFVDQGGGHVHIGRNEGATPVELSVTYLLPVGAGARIDAPRPGNCSF
jgi:Cupin domain